MKVKRKSGARGRVMYETHKLLSLSKLPLHEGDKGYIYTIRSARTQHALHEWETFSKPLIVVGPCHPQTSTFIFTSPLGEEPYPLVLNWSDYCTLCADMLGWKRLSRLVCGAPPRITHFIIESGLAAPPGVGPPSEFPQKTR
jgi:hypothetical protein